MYTYMYLCSVRMQKVWLARLYIYKKYGNYDTVYSIIRVFMYIYPPCQPTHHAIGIDL